MGTWIEFPVASDELKKYADAKNRDDLHITTIYLTDEDLRPQDIVFIWKIVTHWATFNIKPFEAIFTHSEVWGDMTVIPVDISPQLYGEREVLKRTLLEHRVPVDMSYPIWTPHVTIDSCPINVEFERPWGSFIVDCVSLRGGENREYRTKMLGI